MVTAITTPPPDAAARPSGWWTGVVRIPLTEFGQSLANPGLDRWFEAFSARNEDEGQYEISKEGYLLIMAPTGSPGAIFEGEITIDLGFWARESGGVAYPATSCFILPDGSRFGPDAAWLNEERRTELLLPENRPFPRITPDFVAEIKSPSNSRTQLMAKIEAFIRYGTKLGWYIDPETREVIKYRPGQEPEVLHDPEYIEGDADLLPGFRFAVRQRIFDVFASFEQQETQNAAGEQGSPD